MHPNPKRILPVVLLILLAVFAWWYFRSPRAVAQSGALTASGTIEATQITVAPEMSGRVADVLVHEGDPVKAGQELVRLEDRLLQAQLEQAKAAVAVAQANHNLVAAGAPQEQRQLAIAAAELEVTQAQQALTALHDTAKLAAAQAQQAVAAANKQLDQATQRLDNLNAAADQADIDAARAAVTLAKDRLDKALDRFDPYKKKPQDNVTRAILQSQVAEAQKKYDAVVTRLNNLLGKVNQYDQALAESGKALSQKQLDEAQRQYDEVKDGPNPDLLKLAEDRLAAAQAKLASAKAEPSPEQLAVANAQVQAALAALDLVQVQMDKLVIRSPIDGIVLGRAVEPGEVALPGATLLSLANLENLTITVYVPEDRYGMVDLGQKGKLATDSFPGQTFDAEVIKIADQAEFTPRNVQTAEGRRTTVFAIKLAVANPEGKLKPGMPADVEFK
jgi:HlyD family secretion protein